VTQLDDLLESRGMFGMRLGLERMRLLLKRVGSPERTFRTIHVIGTNGKTSTTLGAAAVLAAHGIKAGAYISPHVHGFAERIQADGEPLTEAAVSEAVAMVEDEARRLDADTGDPVTQFEVLTAAAFLAEARRGTEVLVVEAGLGGRYDATNVIAAPVVALTNVALDHVAQLGPTREAIAAEKLAVVAPGSILVTGPLDDEIAPVVHRLAAAAAAIRSLPPPAPGQTFREANARLAELACEAFLGDRYDPVLARAATDAVRIPGRLQVVGEAPLTLLDGAHNPHGAQALAAELPAASGGRRPLIGVIAILADKDVDGVCAALAPVLDGAVATQSTSPRALDATDLSARLAAAGLESEVCVPPSAALARGRELAGPTGAVIAAGSLSLLADLAERWA
jgi:dihydrofolate synthase/folylpolyglutamate synthase